VRGINNYIVCVGYIDLHILLSVIMNMVEWY